MGHIHKDINAYFSYLSQFLKQKDTYVLADSMKGFMDFQKTTTFILEVVQEVGDFKSYIKNFYHNSTIKLFGLGEMHHFKF